MDLGKVLWTCADVEAEKTAFLAIQGYTTLSHGKKYARLALLRYKEGLCAEASVAVARLGSQATTAYDLYRSYARRATENGVRIPVVMAVGISHPGYCPYPRDETPQDDSFKGGFAAMNPHSFGDPPPTRYDAIIVIAADEGCIGPAQAMVDRELYTLASITWEEGEIRKSPGATGGRDVVRDHLGFEEGVSQPVFFACQGSQGGPAWDPKASLSLILTRQPGNEKEFGSFGAYVKFRLNVEAFRQAVAATVECTGRTAGEVESWFMGRDRASSRPLANQGLNENDFNYSNDSNFSVCPGQAHIRKMNPRTADAAANRILRRSALYETEEEKGILFQCFQQSLRSGFERLFTEWAHSPNALEVHGGQDALLGPGGAVPIPRGIPVACPVQVSALSEVKDGEYFFFPSIPFFKRILANRAAPPPAIL